jgi:hypothetical protein
MYKFYFSYSILLNKTRSFLFLTFEMEGLLMLKEHIHFLIIKINSRQNIRTNSKIVLC